MHAKQQEAPALRKPETQKIAWVRLLMDERVLTFGADGMAQDLAWAVLVVDPDIEQCAAG